MITSPQALHAQLLYQVSPAQRYAGGDVWAWQKDARQKLCALLRMPVKNCEDDLQADAPVRMDGYTITRLSFESEKGYRAVAHLLLPEGAKRPQTVICLQGHSTGAHISMGLAKYAGDESAIAGGRDYALQAVRRGYAALALEQRAFGECGGTEKGPDCNHAAYTALLLGRTLLGERVFDVMRALDVLRDHFSNALNANEACVTGNSGGGTTALYAAAADPRIRVCAPSCAFSSFAASIGAQFHCACNYVPDMALNFDMADIAALVAPRALVIVSGREDAIFPVSEARAQAETARAVYAAMGAEDMLFHEIGEGGHRYYPNKAWPRIDAAMKAL